MKAMILAAGFGTRFRPATYSIPKPMVPLCNRPLIAYAVDSLVASGVREIVVNLHHLPEQIETYLRARYVGICDFEFSFEPEILGTGGGIRKARPLLDGESFYVVNGDTIQFPPFEKLEEARREQDAVASLLLRHPPEGDRFTPVFYSSGRVTGLGSGEGEAVMFSGSHAISHRIFDLLPDRDFSGITEDVYAPLLRERGTLAGVLDDGLWFDIGTPKRYMSASRELLALITSGQLRAPSGSDAVADIQSVIAVDAHTADAIVERSSIGSGSSIEKGAAVRESSIWDEASIGAGSRIVRSIVGHGVELPPGTQAMNVLVCPYAEANENPPAAIVLPPFVAVPIDEGAETRFEL
jgi:NDP-sugar pyrophosphorylase family protein